MDHKVFDFYEVFRNHDFSEEEMKSVVDGVRALVKDESKENATKEDINKVIDKISGLNERMNGLEVRMTEKIGQSEARMNEKISGLEVSMAKRFEYIHEKVADYHRTTLTWIVTTAIAVVGVIVGLLKLL